MASVLGTLFLRWLYSMYFFEEFCLLTRSFSDEEEDELEELDSELDDCSEEELEEACLCFREFLLRLGLISRASSLSLSEWRALCLVWLPFLEVEGMARNCLGPDLWPLRRTSLSVDTC